MDDFHVAPGEVVTKESVRCPRAQDFIKVILGPGSEVAQLIDIRYDAGTDGISGSYYVTLELTFTCGPRPMIPVISPERISVRFFENDLIMPWVQCLRKDFPRKGVLHQFITPEDTAVGLCLFAEPWREVRDRIPAGEFLWRIQNWFERSVNGKIHVEDQPLEPAFLGFGDVFIADSLLWEDAACNGFAWFEQRDAITDGHHVFVQVNPAQNKLNPAMVLFARAAPSPHNWIRSEPRTLAQLHDLMAEHDVDILNNLREAFIVCQSKGTNLDDVHQILFVMDMPRILKEDSEASHHVFSFSWSDFERNALFVRGEIGVTDDRVDETRNGCAVPLRMVHWQKRLTKGHASLLSNQTNHDGQLFAVGVGALGSQVLMNGVRQGIGPWVIVENDVLMPHNLVRHTLAGQHVGRKKGNAVKDEANSIWPDAIAEVFPGDFVFGISSPEMLEQVEKSRAIVDMSASGEVVKALTVDLRIGPKRCSLFVSPSGKDFVFFGEPEGREIKLDQIEAQYYAAVARDQRLIDHLSGGKFRGTCRDQSVLLPQELMALHAAQGTRCLRRWLDDSNGGILVVRTELHNFAVRDISIPVDTWYEVQVSNWSVYFADEVIRSMGLERQAALPNETGGVLLGSIDVVRRRLYVSMSIPAPSDSVRKPTSFIRGCQGLARQVGDVANKTLNQVRYLGEWHSHPEGVSVKCSELDREAQSTLAEFGAPTGLPPLMVIISDDHKIGVYLCEQQ